MAQRTTSYVIETLVGDVVSDEQSFDTLEEAKAELEWLRKFQPEYKYRLAKCYGKLLFKAEK